MTQEAFIQHAIRSWVRRQTGTWNQVEETDLQAWLADSAEHREAYEKVARGWELAGELHAFQPRLSEEPSLAHERRPRSIGRILAAAAVISEKKLGAIIKEAEELKLIVGAIIVSTKRGGT